MCLFFVSLLQRELYDENTKRLHPFRITIWQCPVVRFLILKGLSSTTIQAELTSVYEDGHFVYRLCINSIVVSLKEEWNSAMIRDPGTLYVMNSAKHSWP
jgi:hypothetical protein